MRLFIFFHAVLFALVLAYPLEKKDDGSSASHPPSYYESHSQTHPAGHQANTHNSFWHSFIGKAGRKTLSAGRTRNSHATGKAGIGEGIQKLTHTAVHKKKTATTHARERKTKIENDRNAIAQLQKEIDIEHHKKDPNTKLINDTNKRIIKLRESVKKLSNQKQTAVEGKIFSSQPL